MHRRLYLGLIVLLAACTKPPTNTPIDVKWSQWSGRPTQPGQEVTIPQGTSVLLDESPPPLRGLTIDGALVFDRKDLTLQADWVMVHGRLEVGTEDNPFTHKAEIVLTSNNPADNVMNMGAKVLGVMGAGALELHGRPYASSWTRLGATAAKGATEIVLEKAVDWPVGAEIVIASTDHYGWQAGVDPAKPRSERAIIKAVNGPRITLEAPLSYGHYGAGADGIPEFAEVGLLSRNVVVRSDEKARDSSSAAYQVGGHLMVMGGSARLSWVELRNMGQKGKFGRYPLHFHQIGDAGAGSYLRSSSIRESFNRCLVIHGTNRLRVEGNVAFDTFGHCYFLEEGSETDNVLSGNLAVLVRALKDDQRLIPSDSNPAGFWITHPANRLTGNAVAEAGTGYWYALPKRPIPFGRANQDLTWMNDIRPRTTALGEFSANVAHSVQNDGLNVDRSHDSRLCPGDADRNACKDHKLADLTDGVTTVYNPRTDPKGSEGDDAKNPPVVADFKDFVAYKSGGRGVWLRGVNHRLSNPKLGDNAIGVTFASNKSYLEGGLIVGESANGTTRITGTWITGLVGFEHYDGHVGVEGTTFRKFSGTAQRDVYCNGVKTATLTVRNAAIGTLRWTSFGLTGQNYVKNVKIEPGNTAVTYDPPPDPCFTASGRDPHDGYRTAVFYDADGSVTGSAGKSVVVDNPFLLTPDCTARADWNAHVCGHLYGTLSISNDEPSPKPLAGNDLSSALTLTRDGGPSTRLWGMPNAFTYFEARLIANRPGTAHPFTYTAAFGTANRSAKLRVGYNLRALPDGTFPQGSAGSFVRVALPVPSGDVWIYRNYYFSEKNNKTTRVATLAELDADTTGKVYYREGDTVYLKLSLTQADLEGKRSASVNYHVCTTLECK
ncbi:G8 domain protein [Calidithermus terrae]|uniref:G8 domain protein n=1 Tax=Calidithermus terrae TaxID=1408545 RepID=A0A399EVA3_9DEIN|nr:G8 domain-containing protein [Calidithermus terrae]RIH87346.1 G8 domain protein [Calidithermus terrae]